jgi:hypothetical protein
MEQTPLWCEKCGKLVTPVKMFGKWLCPYHGIANLIVPIKYQIKRGLKWIE